ncbi:MAG: response regulator [Verrucomicrobiia bacterium]|jgi:CheY-like chemotaxis protein
MRALKKKRKILCLDDEPLVLPIYKHVLESHGYDVLTAQSSTEALEIMLREPIGLLIQDLARPHMDGIELYRVMKSDERLRCIPVVICSGSEWWRNRFLGQCLGAEAVLAKPFDVALALGVIRKTLQAGAAE